MKRVFPALLLAWAAATGNGQQLPPGEADYFSETIVPGRVSGRSNPALGRGQAAEAEFEKMSRAKAGVEGFTQGLVFHSGAILHGELVAITKTEIVWRRPDVEPALRIPRGEIRRLILRAPNPLSPASAAGATKGNGGAIESLWENFEAKAGKQGGQTIQLEAGGTLHLSSDPKVASVLQFHAAERTPATLQMRGGDWVHGDVRSVDGQKFALQLSGGMAVEVPRAAVEWLYFSQRPTSAGEFSGDPLMLEGWQFGGAEFGGTDGLRDLGEGVLTLGPEEWVGRTIQPLERLMVEWSTPKGSTEKCRLWLQANAQPSPSRVSKGTVMVSVRPGQFAIDAHSGQGEVATVALPEAEPGHEQATQYQVFYDGPKNRLTAFRDGKKIGEWKLRGAALDITGKVLKDADNFPAVVGAVRGGASRAVIDSSFETAPPIAAFSFDGDAEAGKPAKLQSFRLQPWSGILPDGETAAKADVLAGGKEPAVAAGRLESLGEGELVFAGQTKPRVDGTFIQLAQAEAPAPPGGAMAASEARLIFGEEGALTVSALEGVEGRLKGRTSFGTSFDAPVTALQTILFPPETGAGHASDILVFRNGDTLGGTLLGAAKGERLRWRTAGGQEVGFETARLAGVRLQGAAAERAKAGTILEFRNGDRLRGDAMEVEGDRVRLKHGVLGALAPAQASLWALSFGADVETFDGPPARAGERVFLDGHYLQFRRGADQSVGSPDVYSHTFPTLPERYEVRAEGIDNGGVDTALEFVLASAEREGPRVTVTIASGTVDTRATNLPRPKDAKLGVGVFQIRPPLYFEYPRSTSPARRCVRLFVDTKLGTVDVFVNGEPITKFGKKPEDRVPGIGARVEISRVVPTNCMAVVSGLWVGPWSGELPVPGKETAGVCLKNTDFAAGAFKGVAGGNLLLEGGAGALEVPAERVATYRFGGEPAPVQAAARVRLRDGSIVHLDEYRWVNGELQGRSGVLGEIKASSEAVAELVLDPAPVRFPKAIPARKASDKLIGRPLIRVVPRVIKE